jgi:arsenate reductase
MAEGFFRHYAKGNAEIFSAGLEAHGLNAKAVEVMNEAGIDISSHQSKTLDRFIGKKFDYLITVCDHADEHCPYFPGKAIRIHKSFPDPAKAKGTDDEIMPEFRRVRDLIHGFAKDFFRLG